MPGPADDNLACASEQGHIAGCSLWGTSMTARSLLNLCLGALRASLVAIAIAGTAIANSQNQPSNGPTANTHSAADQPASPLNDTATWVTLEDYPTETWDQGTTRYRLSIAPTGRVARCEVTQSSGSQRLDEATCRNLVRRARFHPATNSQGEAIEGSYQGSMRWFIPD